MPKPRGLWNNGNTCYFNATLQNLYRTIVFRRNLVDLWKQETQAPVVIEPTSFESSFLARVWYNVKKLFRNGELRKCFFLCLASLVLYKAGSSGILISTARWIVVQLQGVSCPVHCVQKLSSNVSADLFYADDVATCAVITSQQYLDLLQFCPRCDQPVVVPSLPTWFAVVVLASSVCFCFICCIKHLLRNFFGEGLTRFSECVEMLSSSVTGWWSSRGYKVVLCSSGTLSYCAGHLMASSQPIYEGLMEQNPETLCVLFVMASSTSLLLYRLRVTELVLFRDFRQRSDEGIGVALARLFGNIESSSEASCHNPRSVLEAVCRRSNRFLGFRQQDSHELLRHLLDGIREEERNLKKEANSLTLVDRVFGGHFRTVYTCETCKAPYCLYEAFLDISLPITLHEDTLKEISETDDTEMDSFSLMSQEHSIEFWLKVFTRSENLGKQYLCSACNVSSTGDNYIMTHGIKRTLICDPPAILCIHVKRFRRTADDFVKANDHVEFSEYLDLTPYLTTECERLGENTDRVMYALLGVVVHSGSLEGGHYTAYIKSQAGGGQGVTADNTKEFLQQEGFDWDGLPTGTIGRLKTESLNIRQSSPNLSQTREWYYCSDSTVMPVAANEVFKQAAYLLFYERLC